MTIYSKLAMARVALQTKGLKKTGDNGGRFKYFELADFIGTINEICKEIGLLPVVSFTKETAKMTIYDTEGEGTIEITSPFGSAELRACHEVQNIGAVETYQRRYLYMSAFEIAECDAVDGETKEDVDQRPATQRQIEEFKILGGDLDKLAEALKKDVEDLNFVDLDWAIGQKKARAKK